MPQSFCDSKTQEWLSCVFLAQGFSCDCIRCQRGVQSSEGLTGREDPPSRWLTHQSNGCQVDAGSWLGVSVLHGGLSTELLGCPHSMEAGLLLSEWLKGEKWKVQCFLWPRLGCHTPPLPRYSICPTDQPWFNVGGDYPRAHTMRRGSLRVISEADSHQS